MSGRAEGRSGVVSGGVATIALAAAGWFALGVTRSSTEPPVVDVSTVADVGVTAAPVAGESAWSTPVARRGDHTRPTLRPEARPAVVGPGAPVVLLAHGADNGSGVASETCHTGRLPGFGRPGVHTVTCMVRDRAGNVAVGRTTYRVTSDVGARPARS